MLIGSSKEINQQICWKILNTVINFFNNFIHQVMDTNLKNVQIEQSENFKIKDGANLCRLTLCGNTHLLKNAGNSILSQCCHHSEKIISLNGVSVIYIHTCLRCNHIQHTFKRIVVSHYLRCLFSLHTPQIYPHRRHTL